MKMLFAMILALVGIAAQAPTRPERIPVLIELFTSEGCSSCPPADEVLTRLVATQPVAGVEIIALGEHVDYWDRLGWRDAFSSSAFSRRQEDYAERVFHGGNIYTPQLVVNGHRELVGSDYRRALVTIGEAAKTRPRVQVSVAIDHHSDTQLGAQIQVESTNDVPLLKGTEIWLATLENGITTRVARGENGGKTLQHSAVVRSLRNVAALSAAAKQWSGNTTVTLAGDWTRNAIRIVAFAQDRSTREVLGATVAR